MAWIQRRQRRHRDGHLGPVTWRVRWYDPQGNEQRRAFDREEDAKRFKARVEGDVFSGLYIDPARARETVLSWHDVWRASVVDVRRSTLSRLDSTLATHVLPEFGTLPLSGVSNADVRAWVARMRASGLSSSSVRKAVFALRRMLDGAVADRRLPLNPAENVPLPPEEHGEQRFLDPAEVYELAEVFDHAAAGRFRALVLVAAYGGLRFGELAALRRSRLDVLRGSIQVTETLTDVDGVLSFGPPKTKNGRRETTLPRRIARELDAHLAAFVDPEPDALVFTNTHGQPLRRAGFRRSWWMPAVAAAGLAPLTFHELRHTFVSLWVSLNVNPKEISVRAGHSSVAFTLDRYGHLYERPDDTLADRLDDLLGEVVTPKPAPVLGLERPPAAHGRSTRSPASQRKAG